MIRIFFICFLLVSNVRCKNEPGKNGLISSNKNITQKRIKGKNGIYHDIGILGNSDFNIYFYEKVESVKFKMLGGFEIDLKKNQKGFFERSFKLHDPENAIFSYEFDAYKLDSLGNVYQLNYKPESEEKFFIWVGKNRNIEFKKAYKISGNLDSLNFNSKFLNEYRPIVTYYPENYDKNTPIIYILDGEMINDLYPYIDQMIKDKKIVNLILVGIYSSDKFRYNEYVEGSTNNSNFKKHQNFFYKEVLGHTEVKLNKWRGSRYVFGVSNGGAFAMHAGLNNPNMFKEVIAFSVADYITEFSKPINIKRDQKYPNFYMGAGVYESSFYNDNLRFSKKLAQNNIEVSFNSFCSGHDYIVWKFEFLDYVVKRFKNI